jgi:hypothetical protein
MGQCQTWACDGWIPERARAHVAQVVVFSAQLPAGTSQGPEAGRKQSRVSGSAAEVDQFELHATVASSLAAEEHHGGGTSVRDADLLDQGYRQRIQQPEVAEEVAPHATPMQQLLGQLRDVSVANASVTGGRRDAGDHRAGHEAVTREVSGESMDSRRDSGRHAGSSGRLSADQLRLMRGLHKRQLPPGPTGPNTGWKQPAGTAVAGAPGGAASFAAARVPGAMSPLPSPIVPGAAASPHLRPNFVAYQKRLTARIKHAADPYDLRSIVEQYAGWCDRRPLSCDIRTVHAVLFTQFTLMPGTGFF